MYYAGYPREDVPPVGYGVFGTGGLEYEPIQEAAYAGFGGLRGLGGNIDGSDDFISNGNTGENNGYTNSNSGAGGLGRISSMGGSGGNGGNPKDNINGQNGANNKNGGTEINGFLTLISTVQITYGGSVS